MEESLFLGLEHRLVAPQVQDGFGTVEEFVSFSLSVQNRRKSRAGNAFENHLEALFVSSGVAYSRGTVTEGNRKPDFVFPGIDEYRNPGFDGARLSMLGVKTTCKDRWRQVLTEAARIPEKHLCTLEPAISAAQLAEMAEEGLTLVAPSPVLASYHPPPGAQPMSIGDFLSLVRSRES
jgi:hypothetical protein